MGNCAVVNAKDPVLGGESSTYIITASIRHGQKPKDELDGFSIILHGESHDETVNLHANALDIASQKWQMTANVKLKYVTKITVTRNTVSSYEWYIDSIIVQKKGERSFQTFPIHQWISKIHHYSTHASTCLPNDDPEPDSRKQQLEEARKEYEIEEFNGLPVKVKNLPKNEDFSLCYEICDIGVPIARYLADSVGINMSIKQPWCSIDDFNKLFQGPFEKPKVLEHWMTDYHFGQQRMNHCNSSVIRLCKEIPKKLKFTAEMLKPFLENRTLDKVMDENRLFICDLKIVENLLPVCPVALLYQNKSNELVPIAIQLNQNAENDMNSLLKRKDVYLDLYLETDSEGHLKTKLNDKRDDFDFPIVNFPFICSNIPAAPAFGVYISQLIRYSRACDDYNEFRVRGKLLTFKLMEQDFLELKLKSSLRFTHLIMEGFDIVTHRQLSIHHPVMQLLAPHFKYLMAINKIGRQTLLGPNGWVQKTMRIGTDGAEELIRRKLKDWRLDLDGTIVTDLKNRGLDNSKILPEFYFRDDAIKIYNTIRDYVESYLKLYYINPGSLLNDNEIQSWGQEIVKCQRDKGLGIMGVPNDGNFTTLQQLINTLTPIIFTCSATHAAVNFPQYDEYAFAPNYPAYMEGDPPKDTSPLTEEQVLKSLPDKDKVLGIMIITKVLSNKATNSLGDFPVEYNHDQKARDVVKRFKQSLKDVEASIRKRNKGLEEKKKAGKGNFPDPYRWLEPSCIPNSIAI